MCSKNQKLLKLRKPGGHLAKRATALLRGIGYNSPDERIYRVVLEEKQTEIRTAKPKDIAISLIRGDADVAISGVDCLLEYPGARLLLDLKRPVTKLKLALHDEPEFCHISDLSSFCRHLRAQDIIVHTEYPRLVWRYFSKHPEYRAICNEPPTLDLGGPVFAFNSPLTIRRSSGKTEGNDYFVDTIESGETLKRNKCRAIHTLLNRCTPFLAASDNALEDPWKRSKINEIYTGLCTSLSAEIVSSKLIGCTVNITRELVKRSTIAVGRLVHQLFSMTEYQKYERTT